MLIAGQKIGSWQLTALLIISGLYWLLGWPRPLANPLIMAVGAVLTALAAALYIGAAKRRFHLLLQSIAPRLLVWLFLMLTCLQTTAGFLTELSVLLEGMFSPIVALLALLLVLAAFSALGMEALGRGAFVLLFFVLAAFILLLAGAADQCRISSLQPPELYSADLWGILLRALPLQTEVILYLLLQPSVAKPGKRLYRRYLAGTAALGIVLSVLCALTLGNYAGISAYPFYALARAADLSALSQMTPFYWLLLTCAAVLRAGACFALSVRLWPYGKSSGQAKARWLHAAALLAGYLVLYYTGGARSWLAMIPGIMMIVFLALLIFIKKGGKPDECKIQGRAAGADRSTDDGL